MGQPSESEDLMRRVASTLGMAGIGIVAVLVALAINLGILRAAGNPPGPGHLASAPTSVPTQATSPDGAPSRRSVPADHRAADVPVQHEFGEANDD
jgi:hypothetical protein